MLLWNRSLMRNQGAIVFLYARRKAWARHVVCRAWSSNINLFEIDLKHSVMRDVLVECSTCDPVEISVMIALVKSLKQNTLQWLRCGLQYAFIRCILISLLLFFNRALSRNLCPLVANDNAPAVVVLSQIQVSGVDIPRVAAIRHLPLRSVETWKLWWRNLRIYKAIPIPSLGGTRNDLTLLSHISDDQALLSSLFERRRWAHLKHRLTAMLQCARETID